MRGAEQLRVPVACRLNPAFQARCAVRGWAGCYRSAFCTRASAPAKAAGSPFHSPPGAGTKSGGGGPGWT